MAHLAEVITIYDITPANISAMLRETADRIESETADDNRTKAIVAVQINESGGIKVYGWGQTDSLHSIGVLALGQTQLINGMLVGNDYDG